MTIYTRILKCSSFEAMATINHTTETATSLSTLSGSGVYVDGIEVGKEYSTNAGLILVEEITNQNGKFTFSFSSNGPYLQE